MKLGGESIGQDPADGPGWLGTPFTPGRVTVVVPTYNRADLLDETLESVFAQTYPDWECWVVDDGSTDETSDRIAAWEERSEGRIQGLRQPRQGAPAARNRGTRRGTGEFFQYLDSDDLLPAEKLSKNIETFRDAQADLVFSPWQEFQERPSGRVLSAVYHEGPPPGNDLLSALLRGWWMVPEAFLYRREILNQVGPWDESLAQNQDVDLIFRVGLMGARAAFAGPPPVLHRVHPGPRVSGAVTEETLHARRRVLWKIDDALVRSHRIHAYANDLSCYYWIRAMELGKTHRPTREVWLSRGKELGPPSDPCRGGWYGLSWRVLGPAWTERFMALRRAFSRPFRSRRGNAPGSLPP